MHTAIRFLLTLYSYVFHLVLSLFLIGIAIVASSAGKTLSLGMTPWEGPKVNTYILSLGVLGLIAVFLAVTRIFRFLFPLWALFVAFFMFRGFFLTSYNFAGADEFRGAVWLTIGAIGAFFSSLCVLHSRRR